MRGDELPFAGDFHPDVGQAIAIVVGFAVQHGAFVVPRSVRYKELRSGRTRKRSGVRIWLAKGGTAWVCDN